MKKSPLYTRTGDDGTTSLVGGTRIAKSSPRLDAYGTVDELNSWIGLVAATSSELPVVNPDSFWTAIQSRLFDVGSYLATDPSGDFASMTANPISDKDIHIIEEAIDATDNLLPKLSSFVIPGGTVAACNAHIARTVCRRTERCILLLDSQEHVDQSVLRYINRLSDLLFAVARFNNINTGQTEIFWVKSCLDK